MRGKAQIKAAQLLTEEAFRRGNYAPYVGDMALEPLVGYVMGYVDRYYEAILSEDGARTRTALGDLIIALCDISGIIHSLCGIDAFRAAQRNAHKQDWRREPLKSLFEKLTEEVRELCLEVVAESDIRLAQEFGDVVWVAIMIADHGLMLELEEAS